MKTIKKLWLLSLILSMLILNVSCDGDDDGIVILDAEETGVFLEQDLHIRFTRQQMEEVKSQIAAVEADLENDPDNQDLLGQLEELNQQQELNSTRLGILENQINVALMNLVVRGRTPRLPPPPPPPDPCNCLDLLNFTRLKDILLIGNTEGLEVTVFSENQEELANFGSPGAFEGTALNVVSLDNVLDFQGNVFVQVTKTFEGNLFTYTIAGIAGGK